LWVISIKNNKNIQKYIVGNLWLIFSTKTLAVQELSCVRGNADRSSEELHISDQILQGTQKFAEKTWLFTHDFYENVIGAAGHKLFLLF